MYSKIELISKKPINIYMGNVDNFNNELINMEENKEDKLGTEQKSDKDSVQNQLDSDQQRSKNVSEPNSDGMMGMNEFDDYGQNMDIIMENMYENVTKTNHMFSSLGVKEDEENDLSIIYSQENTEQVDNDFRKNILKMSKHSLKNVSRINW